MRILFVVSSDLLLPLIFAACAVAIPLSAQTPVAVDNPSAPLAASPSVNSAPSQDRPQPASGSAWGPLLRDALQLGTQSVHSQAASGGQGPGGEGMDGMSSAGSFQPGGSRGFAPGGSAGGGRPGAAPDLASLFQMASDLSRGLSGGRTNAFGTALGTLPRLNQWLHNGFQMNFTPGGFRFGSSGGAGGSGEEPGGGQGGSFDPSRQGFSPSGSATASFGSPRGRSGHFDFSASASVSSPMGLMGGTSAGMSSFGGSGSASGASMFGGGSFGAMQGGAAGGAPRAGAGGGMGPGGSGGGQKLPAASLSLHLSF